MSGSLFNSTFFYRTLLVAASLHTCRVEVFLANLLKSSMDKLHKKKKFSIKDLFSKCVQMHTKPQILSHLLTKSLIENFIFCVVIVY